MSILSREALRSGVGATGRASEQKLAKRIGADTRPASGAIIGFGGDMEISGYLMEAKSTVNRSLSVKHEWLGKIAREAREQGLKPALTFSFTHGNGDPVPNGEWVAVPLRHWMELIGGTEE